MSRPGYALLSPLVISQLLYFTLPSSDRQLSKSRAWYQGFVSTHATESASRRRTLFTEGYIEGMLCTRLVKVDMVITGVWPAKSQSPRGQGVQNVKGLLLGSQTEAISQTYALHIVIFQTLLGTEAARRASPQPKSATRAFGYFPSQAMIMSNGCTGHFSTCSLNPR